MPVDVSVIHGPFAGQVVRRMLALLVAACVLSGAMPARAEVDFPTLIQTARDNFVPVDDQTVTDALAIVQQRASDLNRFLGRGSIADGWRRYLHWDILETQLSAEQPDLEELADIYRRLTHDAPGLQRQQFRDLATAMRQFIDLSAAAGMNQPKEVYSLQLVALESELADYAQDPNTTLAQSIGRRLEFIDGLGQAPQLVAAIRARFVQPNAMVTVSEEFLAAAMSKPVERTEPVRDNILGTSIRATANTTATVSVQTLPSHDKAIIELSSVGHTDSNSTGYNGPAVIRSSADTDYTATKRILLSAEAFTADTAEVDATTVSEIHSISKRGGGIGSNAVRTQGWSQARQRKPRADAVASRHAEERIRDAFDEEVQDRLDEAWQNYVDGYRNPLLRRDKLPEHILFSTTEDEMNIEATQATRAQLGAPDAPPELIPSDLVMRLHETAVNNYVAVFLGGATVSETSPEADTEIDATIPTWISDLWRDKRGGIEVEDEESFKPWSLTFRSNQPLTMAFADGKVTMTVHIARLASGPDEFSRWDVTATFTPELTADGGAVLRRDGDLVVLPTGFDTEDGRLSSGQVAIRSNLTKVLNERSAQGRGFPQTIEIDPLEPTGGWEEVGTLAMETIRSEGGWLTVTWNRQ